MADPHRFPSSHSEPNAPWGDHPGRDDLAPPAEEAIGLSPEETRRLESFESDIRNSHAAILVADDDDAMRETTTLLLQTMGYQNVFQAADGQTALDLMRQRPFDLLILDIQMPRLDGFGVLVVLRDEPKLRSTRVIVASGLDDLEAVVRCIELGADDFLPKPANTAILKARVGSLLERKRLYDIEQLRIRDLQHKKQLLAIEQEKNLRLLLNVLPAPIAERLKRGERTIAERYENVTVLFADLVGFSELVNRNDPAEVVALLNDLFSRYDRLASNLGLEKIKTIGDGYMVVAGMPAPNPNHAGAAARMALAMIDATADVNRERNLQLQLRIGLNSGPVVAGVIGRNKFAYDLWGATVNLASRMQSTSIPDRIHVAAGTRDLLADKFRLTERGTVEAKGFGKVKTYILEGRK
jgi:class 3 adenylate cyclase/CheY-like chemotaxis protein